MTSVPSCGAGDDLVTAYAPALQAMDAGVASKDIRRNERVVQAIASRMDNR